MFKDRTTSAHIPSASRAMEVIRVNVKTVLVAPVTCRSPVVWKLAIYPAHLMLSRALWFEGNAMVDLEVLDRCFFLRHLLHQRIKTIMLFELLSWYAKFAFLTDDHFVRAVVLKMLDGVNSLKELTAAKWTLIGIEWTSLFMLECQVVLYSSQRHYDAPFVTAFEPQLLHLLHHVRIDF